MTPELIVVALVSTIFAAATLANCLSNRPPQTATDWVRILAWVVVAAALIGVLFAAVMMGSSA